MSYGAEPEQVSRGEGRKGERERVYRYGRMWRDECCVGEERVGRGEVGGEGYLEREDGKEERGIQERGRG